MKEIDKNEYVQGRALVYKFQAGVFFAPVNEKLHAVFVNDQHQAILKTMFAAETLALFAGFTKTGADKHLIQEFEDLFRVPGPWYTTPYESVFMDTRELGGKQVGGLLHGRSAHSVEKLYRRFGLTVGGEAPDLPDYIGVELSFMAHLSGLYAESLSSRNETEQKKVEGKGDPETDTPSMAFSGYTPHRGDNPRTDTPSMAFRGYTPHRGDNPAKLLEVQVDFLGDHILRWLPLFCDCLKKKAQSDYYRGIARMLLEFATNDLEFLKTC